MLLSTALDIVLQLAVENELDERDTDNDERLETMLARQQEAFVVVQSLLNLLEGE